MDEAIINAIAHRDYAMNLPIDCWLHKDVFIVKNRGRLEQHHHDLPREFTLQNTTLESAPRNRRIIEWLRRTRTPEGRVFVLARGEDTTTMLREMQVLGLPAPTYKQTDAHCTLILPAPSSNETAGAGHDFGIGALFGTALAIHTSQAAMDEKAFNKHRRDLAPQPPPSRRA